MKSLLYYLPLLVCLPSANAQNAVDFNVGFGSAFNSANGGGLDNINSANALGGCVVNAGDPFCQALPRLSGFFLGFGGDVMFREHFGVGAEVNFQPGHPDYGPLQYRQSFIDVNGIYEPIIKKRAIVQLQGGIGTARTSFSFSQSSCVGTAVCTTQAQAVGTATHFQVHVGAGVQIGITEHIFIRPQVDLHYVPNFNDQFGNNVVPEATVWLGYRLGSR